MSSARSRWPGFHRRSDHIGRARSPEHAGQRLHDAANQVKSLAADVERSLSMAGTSTAESIRSGSARSAEQAGHRLRGCGKPGQIARRRRRTHSHHGRNFRRPTNHCRRARSPEHADNRFDGCHQPGQVAGRDVERSLSFAGTATAERSPSRRARSPDHAGQCVLRGGEPGQIAGGRHPARAKLRPRSLPHRRMPPITSVARHRCGTHLDSRWRRHGRFDPQQRTRGAKFADGDFSRGRRPDQGDLRRYRAVTHAVTANTTDNIQTSALNAQSALVAASNEISAKVKSTSAEVERTVLAASGTSVRP